MVLFTTTFGFLAAYGKQILFFKLQVALNKTLDLKSGGVWTVFLAATLVVVVMGTWSLLRLRHFIFHYKGVFFYEPYFELH